MIKAVGKLERAKNPLSKEHNYCVTVCGLNGSDGVFVGDTPEKAFVASWLANNSAHASIVGHYNTVFFSHEDDAILFFLTFK